MLVCARVWPQNEGVTHEPSTTPGLSHQIQDPSGRVSQRPLIPELFGIAETKDGKFVTVMMAFFVEHAALFNRPDILTDERFRPVRSAAFPHMAHNQ